MNKQPIDAAAYWRTKTTAHQGHCNGFEQASYDERKIVQTPIRHALTPEQRAWIERYWLSR